MNVIYTSLKNPVLAAICSVLTIAAATEGTTCLKEQLKEKSDEIIIKDKLKGYGLLTCAVVTGAYSIKFLKVLAGMN